MIIINKNKGIQEHQNEIKRKREIEATYEVLMESDPATWNWETNDRDEEKEKRVWRRRCKIAGKHGGDSDYSDGGRIGEDALPTKLWMGTVGKWEIGWNASESLKRTIIWSKTCLIEMIWWVFYVVPRNSLAFRHDFCLGEYVPTCRSSSSFFLPPSVVSWKFLIRSIHSYQI